ARAISRFTGILRRFLGGAPSTAARAPSAAFPRFHCNFISFIRPFLKRVSGSVPIVPAEGEHSRRKIETNSKQQPNNGKTKQGAPHLRRPLRRSINPP